MVVWISSGRVSVSDKIGWRGSVRRPFSPPSPGHIIGRDAYGNPQIQSCAVSTNQSGVAVRVPLSGGGDGQRWAAPLRRVGGSWLRRR